MNIEELIDNYLSTCLDSDNFYESSKVAYETKLRIFKEYIVTVKSLNSANCQEILRGIDETALMDMLKFYIRDRLIKFKSPVKTYMTVVKMFFFYLHKTREYDIKNEFFNNVQRVDEFEKKLEDMLTSSDLKNSNRKEPISEKAYYELNEYCENIIKSTDIDKIRSFEKTYNHPYDDFVSAVMVKVLMLTGIENSKLINLKKRSIGEKESNILIIGDYKIYLPYKLGVQLNKYEHIVEQYCKDTNNFLFVDKDGSAFTQSDYGKVFRVLSSVFDTASGEIVSKYVIMEMIKVGTNSSIIMDFTGHTEDTYEHCQELVNETREISEKVKYLNKKIRVTSMFDLI